MRSEQIISKDFVDACNRTFGTDCDVEDFLEAFTVYPTEESFHTDHPDPIEAYNWYSDCAKIVNGLYVWFDSFDYELMYAEKAVRKGLVRDDYSVSKNVFIFESYEIRWIYFAFNPDTGIPHFTENCCYNYVVEDVLKMGEMSDDEFFDRLEEECTQYIHNCSDVDDYNAWAELFEESPDRALDAQLRKEIINSVSGN